MTDDDKKLYETYKEFREDCRKLNDAPMMQKAYYASKALESADMIIFRLVEKVIGKPE